MSTEPGTRRRAVAYSFIYSTSYQTEHSPLPAPAGRHCVFLHAGRRVPGGRGEARSPRHAPLSAKQNRPAPEPPQVHSPGAGRRGGGQMRAEWKTAGPVQGPRMWLTAEWETGLRPASLGDGGRVLRGRASARGWESRWPAGPGSRDRESTGRQGFRSLESHSHRGAGEWLDTSPARNVPSVGDKPLERIKRHRGSSGVREHFLLPNNTRPTRRLRAALGPLASPGVLPHRENRGPPCPYSCTRLPAREPWAAPLFPLPARAGTQQARGHGPASAPPPAARRKETANPSLKQTRVQTLGLPFLLPP